MSRKNHNTEQSPYMEYGVQKEQKKNATPERFERDAICVNYSVLALFDLNFENLW